MEKKPLFKNEEEWSGSPESVQYRPDVKVFLLLLGLCASGIVAAAFIFWYIPTVGLKNIHPYLPYITGAVFIGLSLFVLGAVSGIAASLLRGKDVFPSPRFRGLLVKFFLPLMVLLGGLLKVPRIKIEQAFIELNNRMVKAMVKAGKRFSPERILILMPHCIQYDNCKIKVTRDVKNCAGCGRCEIGNLVSLSDEYRIKLFVLTGGTVARRKLMEYRPSAVIAVACERDLTSGVQDAYPLPVIAVINKRPRGYCLETGVEIEDIRRAIRDLLGTPAPSAPASFA
ncbi:MAG: DUF116 domain-containing protein [Deltaproteobacteria bacterium]|nr:DUF116 domain-containing protein [Deltaproteobacteria bacterium]